MRKDGEFLMNFPKVLEGCDKFLMLEICKPS